MPEVELFDAPGQPIPSGRGRWRLTLHSRQFVDANWSTTMIGDLTTARSRQLVQTWDNPAQLAFTMNGTDPAAALIVELETEVMAWRWDENATLGINDVPLFRGIVTQSEEQITEQEHTVNFVCQDYLAMLARRFFTSPITYTQNDQDALVQAFVRVATLPQSGSGITFGPGGYLPIYSVQTNADGSRRPAASGQLRDRTYPAGADLATTLDDLAKIINGFDYDIIPAQQAVQRGTASPTNNQDVIRVFYPYQGVQRFDVPLVFGANVATVDRTISSGDYANFWRVIGDIPPGAADGTPPMYSEQWNADTNNVTVTPIGLWMQTDNAADVNIQSTLDQKAQGDLAYAGIVTASYTLGLRPGWYVYGKPNMGDICPVIVQTGRLNVNANIRVLGIAYDVGDDGQEDVTLTVGRPVRTLTELVTQADRDADALTRRPT